MKIAINGAGIAGPALAYWLHHFGHEPILIERAPAPRTGGYIVDFWGVGFDIAEKMGILGQLKELGYRVQEIQWVNAAGKITGRYDPEMLRRIANGRFVSIERYDLAATIFNTLEGKVETIFGDSIAEIEEHEHGVRVSFENSDPRDVDLVVGADGLHSKVRELAFGPIGRFEKDLGMRVGAVELDGYQPREELVFKSHTEPSRQVSRFTKRGDKTLVLFGFRDQYVRGDLPCDDAGRKREIEKAMAGVGWECPQLLEAMADVDDVYYDKVSQIHLDRWTKGRVALIGDAAGAVSLLAGEGTGLGMLEAYILAGEIHRAGPDYTTAFARYEERVKDFVSSKQKNAVHVGATFVPETRLGIRTRDLLTHVFRGPFIAKLALGNLKDDIEVPDYDAESGPTKPRPGPAPESTRRPEWLQQAVFAVTELLLLPVTVLGYLAVNLKAAAKSKNAGISLTAYTPLSARVMLHESGVRLDEAAKRILYGLPTSSAPALNAMLKPSLLAMRLSGYTPAIFKLPEPGRENIAGVMSARTAFFDDVLDRDWSQVVILGAGYDTRAYGRLNRGLTHVFEVDRPAMQARKTATLDRLGIDRDAVVYVPADLARDPWIDRLVAAGWNPTLPTCFLWEGVTMYLERADVDSTLHTIAARAASGSVVTFDFMTDRSLRTGRFSALYVKAVKPVLKYLDESFRFAVDSTPPLRDNVARLLTEHGLDIDAFQALGPDTADRPAIYGLVAATVPGGQAA